MTCSLCIDADFGLGLSIGMIVPVFGSIAFFAWFFFYAQQYETGLSLIYDKHCPAVPSSSAPNRIPWFGVPFAPFHDYIACLFVAFSEHALSPALRNRILSMFTSIGLVLLPIWLDAAARHRESRIRTVLVPFCWSLVTMFMGVGLIPPIYWIFSLRCVAFPINVKTSP